MFILVLYEALVRPHLEHYVWYWFHFLNVFSDGFLEFAWNG